MAALPFANGLRPPLPNYYRCMYIVFVYYIFVCLFIYLFISFFVHLFMCFLIVFSNFSKGYWETQIDINRLINLKNKLE